MASGAASEEDRIGTIRLILRNPATYIGPTSRHTRKLWVWNSEKGKMVERTMTYVPGILKMFDEILLNAAENRVRDPSMSRIDVSIDFDNDKITVSNDGEGVPVEKDDQGVYVPENMFYSTPASFNSESQYKITGAKLANIFSTEFEIEVSDIENEKLYKQVFRRNMMEKDDPEETPLSTESRKRNIVSFKPELAIFGMERLQGDDVVDLMRTRVHEVAWFLGNDFEVTLEGKSIPVGSFEEYVAKYFLDSHPKQNPRVFAEKIGGGHWDVCLSLSEGQFQQVSFVNSIATIRGGSHVDYVTDLITQHVVDLVNTQNIKKGKDTKLETHHVKAHLRVFVKTRIDKPNFESLLKNEPLLLPHDELEKIVANDILLKKDKVSRALLKKLVLRASTHNNGVGRTEVGTWEDAYNARTHKSNDCILIMTEGKSAKSLAMAGLCALSDVERDNYGIFPLSGKIPNVRSFNDKAQRNSKLINDLKTVLGLGDGMKMRYKSILIMTDQDEDGIHIKGLIINLFHTLWPSLLEQVNPSFISDFITPLITATPLDGDKSKTEYFYSPDDYDIWEEKEKQGKDKLTGWTIQHYKGLGAFTSEDGKELFSRLSKQQRFFVLGEVKDEDYKAIEDAFNKDSQPRKDSITKAATKLKTVYKGWTVSEIRYKDFMEKECIMFTKENLRRSIPSSADGLKPVERKILHSFLKRKLTERVKLSQLYGYVAEDSDYQHSEQSLAGTIVKMAQNYVGTNNINLLEPLGQFGSRAGDDKAEPRYLYTRLSPVTMDLFPKENDFLLAPTNTNRNEGPERLFPIIPIVLVNGCCGVASGWHSFIPNYNPLDIVANMKRKIRGEEMVAMKPWYMGFEGEIEDSKDGRHKTIGKFSLDEEKNILRITELPIGRSKNSYKKFLIKIGGGSRPLIQGFKDRSSDIHVDFELQIKEDIKQKALKKEWVDAQFNLVTYIDTKCMYLFDDETDTVKSFETPEDIIDEFYTLMIGIYEDIWELMEDNLKHKRNVASNKHRFVSDVAKTIISLQSDDLVTYFKENKFEEYPTKKTYGTDDKLETYGHLLDLGAKWFNAHKIKELEACVKDIDNEIAAHLSSNYAKHWLKNLELFERSQQSQPKTTGASSSAAKKVAREEAQEKQGGPAGSKRQGDSPPDKDRVTKKPAGSSSATENSEQSSSFCF